MVAGSFLLGAAATGDHRVARTPQPCAARISRQAVELMERELTDAWSSGASVLSACDRWYSGAYVLETAPCALYILMLHAADPEEAIERAVNDTWDNDTIAAIVGALHGAAALPKSSRDGLSGRTAEEDEGRIWSILRGAEVAFSPVQSR